MHITLKESNGSRLEKSGDNYSVVIISAGQGSSGNYPADTLALYGASAWPSGTQIFLDHLKESDEWERNGNHSIKDLAGVTTTTPVWNAETNELTADIKIFSNHAQFVEEAFPYIGLSVEAKGIMEGDDIVNIAPSPLNAISIVPRAGRGGKFKELKESLVESHKEERAKMTEEQIKALVEGITSAVTTAVSTAVAPVIEALKPAEPEPKDEVDFAEVIESAIDAGLPKIGRERVMRSVREGAKPEDAIASEKSVMEEYAKMNESKQDEPTLLSKQASKQLKESLEDILKDVK